MEKKICSKCRIEKEICEFHKGNDKNGYQYKCKECKKEYAILNVNKENNRKALWLKNNPNLAVEIPKSNYGGANPEIYKVV